jgi:hypothetical protein
MKYHHTTPWNFAGHSFLSKVIIPFIIACYALCLETRAQTVSIPKDEFELYVPETNLKIVRGDTSSVEVFILKSRAYRKSVAEMGLSSNLPTGMLVQFSPDKGHIEKSVVQIVVGHKTAPGRYHLIVNSTIRYRTKGIIISLEIL